MDRDRVKQLEDQWVLPADAVSISAVWVRGLQHKDMIDGQMLFVPSHWDPKAEVNPWTIVKDGIHPLQALNTPRWQTTCQ